LNKTKLFNQINTCWYAQGGYADVLKIAIPLILSTGSWSLLHFIDRMFLTWYSPTAIAAAMPAGILNFTFCSIFIGAGGYVTTFIAQYYGAEKFHRIGPAMWQGIYLAILGGCVLLLTIPVAPWFFNKMGHEPEIVVNEIIYYQVLCYGSFPAILSSVLSGFYSGLGKTWPVMWISLLSAFINIVLDYAFIFGHFGFNEMGIRGAAIATNIAAFSSVCVYLVMIFRPKYNKLYATLNGWMLELKLLLRLLKFGLPNGIQFFLEVAGFTVFIFMLGRLGTIPLAASNIAFSINTIAFMPLIGVGMAISILVGQHLGENNPELAEKSSWSGFKISLVYAFIIMLLYGLVPQIFISPFLHDNNIAFNEEILSIGKILLKFIAIYTLFDALNITFGMAIKGAGDTFFVMLAIVFLSFFTLVLPSYIAINYFNASIYQLWAIASFYVFSLGLTFFLRFKYGKWKSMRVIEQSR
jgi:multidrug resistance protein, MATE family